MPEIEIERALKRENELGKFNREKQRLFRNRKCHEIVLELLNFQVEQSIKESSAYRTLVIECCVFLIRFCR